ncbi:MAG: ABC transporter substrate-binding protein [Rhodospirillales bacterium]|nr:ABC transporter substrate-binding protein [Rhodospirillales bacterium]
MHFRTLMAALLVMASTAAMAQQQGVTDKEILLGEVEPLTGPPALLGIAYNVGTKIAIAEANKAGGVNGRMLKLIVEDDGYVSARTLQALRKLIEVDKIFALTSLSGSGASVAALPVVEKAGLPTMASIAPISQLFQPPRKNVFAVGQTYEEGMYQLTRYLAMKFPDKKWGILTQDDDYGATLKGGFGMTARESKLNVVYQADYKKGQQDFSSEMLKVRSSGAEIFLAGGVIAETVGMVRELEKLNAKPVTAMFWPGRVSATLKLMGPAGDGIYAVDYVEAEDSAAYKAFLEKAKTLVGEAEIKAINRYTIASYVSTRVLIEAMRRCGKALTWECTIAEIEKTENFKTGLMGPVNFGKGVRFSSQAVRIMRADFATLSYKPVE